MIFSKALRKETEEFSLELKETLKCKDEDIERFFVSILKIENYERALIDKE
ncbi:MULTISPECIES: hypothetical protein [Prochlorococcus]|uniref:hypothetical protein n=1 Tax=Prochlorococcus TaxID=1218 RepID=UPI000533BAB9|nr:MULTISPECIES: hypothetical protein [Prochlorococcus]KGG12183.1 hypothetical protein EV05_1388 [Prochlorococcus sp. MIT 0601]